MLDTNHSIYCDFKVSDLNPNLYVCKYCNVVISAKNYSKIQNIVCSVQIEKAAMDPRFDQIKLLKTTVETSDGKKISETIHDTSIVEKSKILSDWWFYNPSQIYQTSFEEQMRLAPSQSLDDFKNNNSENQCSQEQIDARLEICKTCEFYQNNSCLKCGCSLSRDRNFMNKLYWKNKSCPIGKWGSVE